MKKILILLVLFSTQLTLAQNDSKIIDDNNIYALKGLQTPPEFPGGIGKLHEFFNANFKLPDGATVNAKSQMYLRFVIEKDGSMTDIKALRDSGPGAEKEAIRVLQTAPKWIPGRQNGKIVRVDYVLPIKPAITNPPAKK